MGARPGLRRGIPSVDALLRSDPGRRGSGTFGRALVKRSIAATLEDVRVRAERGIAPPPNDVIMARALALASYAATGLADVINATGVVLHTGLGRAPLPEVAVEAVRRTAGTYSDLEVDRATGKRGKRSTRAEAILTALTGAGSALVVNNGAAALLLALTTIARRKEVLVSRGELIEIGGEFRIPDIMAASGARLVEVGTTNRTRLSDYRSALSEKTAAVLKVHPSNYRVVGFTAAPATGKLADLAHKADLPFVFDLGSGLLDRSPGIPPEEPSAIDALRDGADLVIFSGDKLLGGPQAGIVMGRADLVDRLRRHPFARPLRVDKMQIAALEAVLAAYARGEGDRLPVWETLREPTESVRQRAERLSVSLDGELEGAHVIESEAVVGGGSMPGYAVPSWAVELRVPHPPAFAARLRTGRPSVFCRTGEGSVVFDLRTVQDDLLPHLTRAIQYALEGDELPDEE